jgi:hypothetical protein
MRLEPTVLMTVKRPAMKLDADEKELLESVDLATMGYKTPPVTPPYPAGRANTVPLRNRASPGSAMRPPLRRSRRQLRNALRTHEA